MKTGEASQEPEIALDEAASRRALDAIRREAVDGLLALPRVGMGIGGILAGTRRGNRLQILARTEIPCTHALGPGFLLTAEELENARQLVPGAEPLEVLGIYISKTRAALEPGPSDLEILEALCPGEEKIVLMIRPSTVEPVKAILFTREPGGRAESRFEFRMDSEESPAPEEAPVSPPNLALQAVKLAGPEMAHEAAPHGAIRNETKQAGEPAPAMPVMEEKPAGLPPAVNQPEVKPSPASRPRAVLFREYEERERPRRAVLLTCAAAALIAVAALGALDILTPKPELTLNVREENGALVFRWNREAAGGARRGRLLVNDGGQLHEFPLDATRIDAGFFQYPKKSDRIVAKLVLGDQSARAVFFGRPPAGTSGTGSGAESGKPARSYEN